MGATGFFNPNEAINGTYGTLIINGMEVLEFESMSATMDLEHGEINQPHDLWTGYKMVGLGGSGEFTVTRLNHRYIKEWSNMIMRGEHPEIVMMVVVDDPASADTLTAVLRNVVLDNIPIINLEPKTIVKDTYNFKYSRLEFPR